MSVPTRQHPHSGEPPLMWFTERATPSEHHHFGINGALFAGRTRFQDVAILDTREYGKMLVIDGHTQSAQQDEYIYHEALVHPVMLGHPDPRHVLIIGGGEGATLREVLRYRSVERAVMVDIDQELVELCQKHLPEWHAGAFDDVRVELVFADGKRYIETTDATFDVIIIDICDALEPGPAIALYTEAFYRRVRSRLAPGGILVVQAMELSGIDLADHREVRESLKLVFSFVTSYAHFIPSFWADWAFVIASDDADAAAVAPAVLAERLRRRGPGGFEDLGKALRFYDPQTHVRMFALSKDVRTALDIPPAFEGGGA
jgi:spermidine synthase